MRNYVVLCLSSLSRAARLKPADLTLMEGLDISVCKGDICTNVNIKGVAPIVYFTLGLAAGVIIASYINHLQKSKLRLALAFSIIPILEYFR